MLVCEEQNRYYVLFYGTGIKNSQLVGLGSGGNSAVKYHCQFDIFAVVEESVTESLRNF